MVFDCFTFFNELDLLEVRLHELNEVVDKFILVEATRTFQKAAKPLYFEENKERFQQFLPKIEQIVVDKYPSFFKKFRVPTSWDYENHQRETILKGLLKAGAKADDFVIISDIDEIPKGTEVPKYLTGGKYKIFEQRLFYYFFNGISTYYDTTDNERNKFYNREGLGFWRGPVMIQFKDLKQLKTIKKTRIQRGILNHPNAEIIKDAGWHFTYLGGIEKIIKKLEAYAHTEFNTENYKSTEYLEKVLAEGRDLMGTNSRFKFVEIDETFPKYLQENQEKFQHLIKTL